MPGVGLTSASSLDPAGNQLTRSGAESFSHGRAAVDTTSDAEAVRAGRVDAGLNDLPRLRELEALLLVARELQHDDARRVTEGGRRRARPAARWRSVLRTPVVGVTIVASTRSFPPTSQPTSDERRTVTVTSSCSPEASLPSGHDLARADADRNPAAVSSR